jgi:chaperone BCS1
MANHLKYDIYDLDVSEFDNNPDYLERWLIPGLPSRTVVVVEDIDCTIKPQNQGEKKVRINILQCIAI